MSHPRQLIRKAVAAALQAASVAGGQVFTTRVIPFARLTTPAVTVYALNEPVEQDSRSTAPRELKRSLELAVEGLIQENPNLDDDLDTLALNIERAMHKDSTFGGLASDSFLSETTIDIVENGKTAMGVVRLVYTVWYFTYAPEAADTTLDDLDTVDSQITIGDVTVEDLIPNLES